MAILVMLNNFLHDLTAAAWICSAWLLVIIRNHFLAKRNYVQAYLEIFPFLLRLSLLSLILNLLFGVVRFLNYYQFEYLPAAGRGQIIALVIKHILIASLVIWAGLKQWSMFKEFNRITSGGK